VRRSWGLRPRRVGTPQGGWDELRLNTDVENHPHAGGDAHATGGDGSPPQERPGGIQLNNNRQIHLFSLKRGGGRGQAPSRSHPCEDSPFHGYNPLSYRLFIVDPVAPLRDSSAEKKLGLGAYLRAGMISERSPEGMNSRIAPRANSRRGSEKSNVSDGSAKQILIRGSYAQASPRP